MNKDYTKVIRSIAAAAVIAVSSFSAVCVTPIQAIAAEGSVNDHIQTQARAVAAAMQTRVQVYWSLWVDKHRAYLESPTTQPEPSWPTVAEITSAIGGYNVSGITFAELNMPVGRDNSFNLQATIGDEMGGSAACGYVRNFLPMAVVNGNIVTIPVLRPALSIGIDDIANDNTKVNRDGSTNDGTKTFTDNTDLTFGKDSKLTFDATDGGTITNVKEIKGNTTEFKTVKATNSLTAKQGEITENLTVGQKVIAGSAQVGDLKVTNNIDMTNAGKIQAPSGSTIYITGTSGSQLSKLMINSALTELSGALKINGALTSTTGKFNTVEAPTFKGNLDGTAKVATDLTGNIRTDQVTGIDSKIQTVAKTTKVNNASNADSAGTATNLSGGTVSATTGTYSGTLTANGGINAANILPLTNNTYDMGTSANKWRNVYATNLYGSLIGGTVSGTTGTFTGTVKAPTFQGNLTGGTVAGTTGSYSGLLTANSGLKSTTGSFSGAVTAPSVTATTFTGSLSGNASTATKLATARLINGRSFDGSTNVVFGQYFDADEANAITDANIYSKLFPVREPGIQSYRWVTTPPSFLNDLGSYGNLIGWNGGETFAGIATAYLSGSARIITGTATNGIRSNNKIITSANIGSQSVSNATTAKNVSGGGTVSAATGTFSGNLDVTGKLSVAGGISNGLKIYSQGSTHTRYNVVGAEYTDRYTGAYKITLPVKKNGAYISIEIEMMDYQQQVSRLVIGGYLYGGTAYWYNNTLQILGGYEKGVTTGYDDNGYACIYLGDASTSWFWNKIAVTRVTVGNANVDGAWTISRVSSLTGTGLTALTPNKSMTTQYARNVTGNGTVSAATGTFTGAVSAPTFSGNLSGVATRATSLGNDDSIKLYAQNNNEINFGGTNTGSTIYIGDRATDSRPVPTNFIFGGSTGTAKLTAGSASLSGQLAANTGKFTGAVTADTFTGSLSGNAATATAADYLTPQFTTDLNMQHKSDLTGYSAAAYNKPDSYAGYLMSINYGYGNNNGWGAQLAMSELNRAQGGTAYFRVSNSATQGNWAPWQTMLTSVNYGNYALPLSGGTLTGQITANLNGGSWIVGLTGNGAIYTDGTTYSTAYFPMLKMKQADSTFNVGGSNQGFGIYRYDNSRTTNGYDSRFIMNNAGNMEASGSITAPTFVGTLSGHATSDLALAGGTMTGTVNYNDTSRYWLATATNWGMYWNTSENQLQFHGLGVNKANVDLDTGYITAPQFVGNASTATTATTATNVSGGTVSGTTGTFTGTVTAPKFDGTATSVGNDNIKIYGYSSNEINFGGASTGSTVYLGYRATDSRPVPANFVFGDSGSAKLTAGSASLSGQLAAGSAKVGGTIEANSTTNAILSKGQIIVDPTTSGSYREGIRINKASNNWASFNLGGAAGSTYGLAANSGQWFIASNPSNNLMISDESSNETTGMVFYGDGSDPTWENAKILTATSIGNYKAKGFSGNRNITVAGIASGAVNSTFENSNANTITLAGVGETEYAQKTPGLYTLIDVSSAAYDQDTYYPVVGSGLKRNGYTKISVNIQLDSGTKPTWSTHSSGYTANMTVYAKASGWGATDGKSYITDYSYMFADKNPIGYSQIYSSSSPVVWVRGGGKYPIYSSEIITWNIKTAKYSPYTDPTYVDIYFVTPTTTEPGISGTVGGSGLCGAKIMATTTDNVYSATNVSGGTVSATTGLYSGLLTANNGITATTGTYSKLLTANQGATVNGGVLAANGGLTASTGTYSKLLTANQGATVNGGVLAANSGLTATTGNFSGSVNLNKNADISTTAAFTGPFAIGNITGAHIEMDANEILAKASATTASTLYLNHEGGQTYTSSLAPYADNSRSLGLSSKRWSDVQTVKLNGATPITSSNYGSYALPLSGGSLSGQLVVNPPSSSYREGIRINRAPNGWTSLNLGGVPGSTSGLARDSGQWWIGAGIGTGRNLRISDEDEYAGSGLELYANGNAPTWKGATMLTTANYGNYTASSATKLATARTIAIGTAATGTATAFDGTANITIPVTALNASYLSTGIIPTDRLNAPDSVYNTTVEYANQLKISGTASTPLPLYVADAQTASNSDNLGGYPLGNILAQARSDAAADASSKYLPLSGGSLSGTLYANKGVLANGTGNAMMNGWHEIIRINTGNEGAIHNPYSGVFVGLDSSRAIYFGNNLEGRYYGYINSGGWNGNINGATPITAANIGSYASGGIVGESKTQNGYIKFSNGIIMQWGVCYANRWVSYPIPFPNATFTVVATKGNGYYGGSDPMHVLDWNRSSFYPYGFEAFLTRWFAIGY